VCHELTHQGKICAPAPRRLFFLSSNHRGGREATDPARAHELRDSHVQNEGESVRTSIHILRAAFGLAALSLTSCSGSAGSSAAPPTGETAAPTIASTVAKGPPPEGSEMRSFEATVKQGPCNGSTVQAVNWSEGPDLQAVVVSACTARLLDALPSGRVSDIVFRGSKTMINGIIGTDFGQCGPHATLAENLEPIWRTYGQDLATEGATQEQVEEVTTAYTLDCMTIAAIVGRTCVAIRVKEADFGLEAPASLVGHYGPLETAP
jgi:hypothetical protein